MKEVLIGIGAIVFVIAIFLTTENVRGKRALMVRVKHLTDTGEVLTPSIPSIRPGTNENAFVALTNLMNRGDAIIARSGDGPPPLAFAAPGKLMRATDMIHWGVTNGKTNDWKALEPDLEQAGELFDLIAQATQLPAYDSEFNYETGFVDFQLAPLVVVKQATQLLSMATLFELKNGNRDAAHRFLTASVRLVAMQTPEPLAICQLVRYATATIAFGNTWQALHSTNWTESQLAELQNEWTRCDFPNDLIPSLQMERNLGHSYFEAIQSSPAALNNAVENREASAAFFSNPPVTRGFVLKRIHVPLWQIAWSHQDQVRSLNRFQLAIDRARFAVSNSWTALPDPTTDEVTLLFGSGESLDLYDRLRFLFSSDSFSLGDPMIRRALATGTAQQIVITAIALERYRIRAGSYPARLEDLIPDYLPNLPRDHMDGNPLRYRLNGQNSFTLYSVGYDGKDDGGDPALISGSGKFRELWAGLDAVWPEPASPEETTAAIEAADEED